MAAGLSASIANLILDALTGEGSSFSASAAFYAKLHTADPGASGTTAAASETTREEATFSAASAGSITNSADIVWTSVSASETYTHVSFWTASSAGTFLCSVALDTSKAVTSGDDFKIASGDLVIDLTPIAA